MPATHITIGGCRIEITRGDITTQQIDAIVNAANSGLRGGGGVDGAIHRKGGPSIMEECRKIGGCPTGHAVVTGAGNLPSRWVIHAVGPIYTGLPADEKNLASAYRKSLERATEVGARSVAFPSLSTGAYGYPIDQAAPTALGAVAEYIRERHDLDRIVFVLFSDADYAVYHRLLPDYAV